MHPSRSIADLACQLAQHAEAVCRHYLPNGRRQGRYWLVGNIDNTPGRSLYVRLFGPDSGKGAAGKWTDAATGSHGDLLDRALVVAKSRGRDLTKTELTNEALKLWLDEWDFAPSLRKGPDFGSDFAPSLRKEA